MRFLFGKGSGPALALPTELQAEPNHELAALRGQIQQLQHSKQQYENATSSELATLRAALDRQTAELNAAQVAATAAKNESAQLLSAQAQLQAEIITYLKELRMHDEELRNARHSLADTDYELEQVQIAFRCTSDYSMELEAKNDRLESRMLELSAELDKLLATGHTGVAATVLQHLRSRMQPEASSCSRNSSASSSNSSQPGDMFIPGTPPRLTGSWGPKCSASLRAMPVLIKGKRMSDTTNGRHLLRPLQHHPLPRDFNLDSGLQRGLSSTDSRSDRSACLASEASNTGRLPAGLDLGSCCSSPRSSSYTLAASMGHGAGSFTLHPQNSPPASVSSPHLPPAELPVISSMTLTELGEECARLRQANRELHVQLGEMQKQQELLQLQLLGDAAAATAGATKRYDPFSSTGVSSSYYGTVLSSNPDLLCNPVPLDSIVEEDNACTSATRCGPSSADGGALAQYQTLQPQLSFSMVHVMSVSSTVPQQEPCHALTAAESSMTQGLTCHHASAAATSSTAVGAAASSAESGEKACAHPVDPVVAASSGPPPGLHVALWELELLLAGALPTPQLPEPDTANLQPCASGPQPLVVATRRPAWDDAWPVADVVPDIAWNSPTVSPEQQCQWQEQDSAAVAPDGMWQ